MNPSKGLGTYAGLVAAAGQYAIAIAAFLAANDQEVALGPLLTATATLITVIHGRMAQARDLAAAAPRPDREVQRVNEQVADHVARAYELTHSGPSINRPS